MPKGTYRLNPDRVLALAFHRGWTEAELLRKAGLSPHVIYRAKKGGTTYPGTIHVLALTLGVEPEDIIIKKEK